jgi:hypothetical protein
LEKEIANLVNAVAAGKDSACVLDGIKVREAQVEALKATPEAPKPFDRAAFLKAMGAKSFWGVLVSSPQQTRAMLKKLQVTAIIPRPDPQGGWVFSDPADLACLIPGLMGERAG